jgi:hypothetical protein
MPTRTTRMLTTTIKTAVQGIEDTVLSIASLLLFFLLPFFFLFLTYLFES